MLLAEKLKKSSVRVCVCVCVLVPTVVMEMEHILMRDMIYVYAGWILMPSVCVTLFF